MVDFRHSFCYLNLTCFQTLQERPETSFVSLSEHPVRQESKTGAKKTIRICCLLSFTANLTPITQPVGLRSLGGTNNTPFDKGEQEENTKYKQHRREHHFLPYSTFKDR